MSVVIGCRGVRSAVSDLAVTNSSLPACRLGVPYGATAQASGGSAPYAWTAGGLPAGLEIDSATGQITGTPTAAPTSAVTLSVKGQGADLSLSESATECDDVLRAAPDRLEALSMSQLAAEVMAKTFGPGAHIAEGLQTLEHAALLRAQNHSGILNYALTRSGAAALEQHTVERILDGDRP
jgi:hypothetical protein